LNASERLVCCQLAAYLEQKDCYQSPTVSPQARSKTAVLKIVTDFLFPVDRGEVTLLSLLDLYILLPSIQWTTTFLLTDCTTPLASLYHRSDMQSQS